MLLLLHAEVGEAQRSLLACNFNSIVTVKICDYTIVRVLQLAYSHTYQWFVVLFRNDCSLHGKVLCQHRLEGYHHPQDNHQRSSSHQSSLLRYFIVFYSQNAYFTKGLQRYA